MTRNRLPVSSGHVPERREGDRLRKAPALLEAVLASAAVAMAVLDSRGRIVLFNRAAELLTGFTPDQARGRAFWELVLSPPELDVWRSAFEPWNPAVLPAWQEVDWRRQDGSARRVAVWNSVIEVEAGSWYVVTIGVDVTELRSAERRVIEAGEHERRRLGQDLHDALGQELTGIALSCKALESRLAGRSPEDAAEVRRTTELAVRAMHTTRALAKGHFLDEFSGEELAQFVQEMAEWAEETFRVRCELSWCPDFRCTAPGCARHLYWIVQEAVTNAIRHGQATRIDIRAAVESGRPHVVIRDNGKGFPADRTPTGIGLQIMASRARAIGAELRTQNHPGGGVQVECILPPPALEGGKP